MLRCVKTSPGCKPRRVVSGTRESEQPSQTVSSVSLFSFLFFYTWNCPRGKRGRGKGGKGDIRILGDCPSASLGKKVGF